MSNLINNFLLKAYQFMPKMHLALFRIGLSKSQVLLGLNNYERLNKQVFINRR